jgi:hypothetical protein
MPLLRSSLWPFPMQTALPPRSTTATPPRTGPPSGQCASPAQHPAGAARAEPARFPCSLCPGHRVRHPAQPRRPPSRTQTRGTDCPDERPPPRREQRLSDERRPHRNTGPYPPDFEPGDPNGESHTGSLRIPSRLARPTRTIWQCWHVPTLSEPACHPTRNTPHTDQAALSFNPPPATDRPGRSPTSPKHTAPHGAPRR